MKLKQWIFYTLVGFLSISLTETAHAQQIDGGDDESKLYAQTKLVNQFFRRFNGEEDEKGNRYYSDDKNYRDQNLRKKYLGILFDNQNSGVSNSLKREFIQEIVDKGSPRFLDFHKGEWMAEVGTVFTYLGKDQPVTLFLKIQPQRLGYEWVIEEVYFDAFRQYFNKDTTDAKKFLHPLSHELDFMNLRKALEGNENPESFTPQNFEPSFLTLFLYEIKKGSLRFKTVKDVKFHFFQIENWYFELSEFNRDGYNTGWLISNLVKTGQEDKQAIKNYLYGKR